MLDFVLIGRLVDSLVYMVTIILYSLEDAEGDIISNPKAVEEDPVREVNE